MPVQLRRAKTARLKSARKDGVRVGPQVSRSRAYRKEEGGGGGGGKQPGIDIDR